MNDKLLSVEEASDILGVSEATLNTWRVNGLNVPYFKIGGAVRYKESDLREYIEWQKVKVVRKIYTTGKHNPRYRYRNSYKRHYIDNMINRNKTEIDSLNDNYAKKGRIHE